MLWKEGFSYSSRLGSPYASRKDRSLSNEQRGANILPLGSPASLCLTELERRYK